MAGTIVEHFAHGGRRNGSESTPLSHLDSSTYAHQFDMVETALFLRQMPPPCICHRVVERLSGAPNGPLSPPPWSSSDSCRTQWPRADMRSRREGRKRPAPTRTSVITDSTTNSRTVPITIVRRRGLERS